MFARACSCTFPLVQRALFRQSSLSFRAFAAWSQELEPGHKFKAASEIVNKPYLHDLLQSTKKDAQNIQRVKAILQTAKDQAFLKNVKNPKDASEYVCGLTYEETATLLNIDSNDEDLMKELFDTALSIKRRIYGNRIVLFAPLYLSNYCINNCTYCGYRGENCQMHRSMLDKEDIKHEVEELQKMGHKRLLLLCGEHPKFPFERILESLKLISEVHTPPFGEIRRINVEIPSLSVSDFRRLKDTGVVGTYTMFQETFDPDVYSRFHLEGPKADYSHRLLTMDRAMTAGIDDVGLGALFGLGDYRFEVLGLLAQANHLQSTYGAGPHTISIPRIKSASNAPTSQAVPHAVSDADFKKLVAVIRCAVPYTGMILSTRENQDVREALLKMGISQLSAGSNTKVGGYNKDEHEQTSAQRESGQFGIEDTRSLDEVVADLFNMGFIPSWCTACYRCGRTGEEFMKIARAGEIHNYCHPNAILTMKEYLNDYASPSTRELGLNRIETEIESIRKSGVREELKNDLERLDDGERDLYY